MNCAELEPVSFSESNINTGHDCILHTAEMTLHRMQVVGQLGNWWGKCPPARFIC